MAMAEQQWSSYPGAWSGTRSEHAISNPIMVQGGGSNGGMGVAGSVLSPRENSLCNQIIANVLGSSPGSLSAQDGKYRYPMNAVKVDDGKLLNGSDDKSVKSSNDTVDSSSSVSFIQMPYQPSEALALGTTPDYQYPFMLQGQPNSIIYQNTPQQPLSTTPNGYGYGSFTAVYNNGTSSHVPPQPDPALTPGPNVMPGARATPPASAIYSSSPSGNFHFPMAAYPPQPSVNHITSGLSGLTMGPPQSNVSTRRDSFSSSGQQSVTPTFGMQAPAPHQYLFMNYPQTPPTGSLGSSPNFFGNGFTGTTYNPSSMFPGSSTGTHMVQAQNPRTIYTPQPSAISQINYNPNPMHVNRRIPPAMNNRGTHTYICEIYSSRHILFIEFH
ncbi:hypothetical protein AB6A40_009136 [Gnathostoma spinigerum]|uniref:Uncharacterized protein n=1 Tax=Gnathostoma spinigerum TaxID=75299 RepID=A0ABD6F014_9BILA